MPEKLDLSKYNKVEELPAEHRERYVAVPATGNREEGFAAKDAIADPHKAYENWVSEDLLHDVEHGLFYSNNLDTIPAEMFKSPEFQTAAKKGFARLIAETETGHAAMEFAEKVRLHPRDIGAIATEQLCVAIDTSADKVRKISQNYHLSAEKIGPLVVGRFLNELKHGKYYEVLATVGGLKNSFRLPEFQLAAQQGVAILLRGAQVHSSVELIEEFQLSTIFQKSDFFTKAAEEGYIGALQRAEYLVNQNMQRARLLKPEFLESAAVKEAAKESVLSQLNAGKCPNPMHLQHIVPSNFIFSTDAISAAEKGLPVALGDRTTMDWVFVLLNVIPFSEKFLTSPDIHNKAVEAARELLQYGVSDRVKILFEKCKLQSQEFRPTILTNFVSLLEKDEVKLAISILEYFESERDLFISPEAVVAKKIVVLRALDRGTFFVHNVHTLIKRLDIPNIVYESSEVAELIRKNYPADVSFTELQRINETPQVGARLAESLRGLTNFSYEGDVKPIIASQGPGAFLYFDAIRSSVKWPYNTLSRDSVDFIVNVSKKYNVNARNILSNIICHVSDPGAERPMVENYIRDINIIDFSLYERYREATMLGHAGDVERMRESIHVIHDAVYRGETSEEIRQDPKYGAVVYHVFQPAIGITRNEYETLISKREDRNNQIPNTLAELQYDQFSVNTGRFVLGEGEDLDLTTWQLLGEVVKKVNATKDAPFDETNAADRVVEMWQSRTWNSDENRKFLYEAMYRYHLKHDGGELPSEYEITRSGLMQYKEFIGDRIKNDLVKSYLQIWRDNHPAGYDQLKKDISTRTSGEQAQTFAQLKNRFNAIRKKKGKDKEKAIASLDDFLADFNLSYERVNSMRNLEELKTTLEAAPVAYEGDLTEQNYRTERYYNSPEFVDAYDTFLAKRDLDELLYRKISSDLVADVNRTMRKQVEKFSFESEGKAEQKNFEFVISKKKEHAVAGYNMGVCVAPDEKLWNDETFMNCIIFDPETKRAMGGMHFLIREGNLCLPGINPSLEILANVNNEELFDQMVGYAKRVARQLGLKQVLIPSTSSIYSNRNEIQNIVRKKAYKETDLSREAEFSYSPYKYSFQRCFVV